MLGLFFHVLAELPKDPFVSHAPWHLAMHCVRRRSLESVPGLKPVTVVVVGLAIPLDAGFLDMEKVVVINAVAKKSLGWSEFRPVLDKTALFGRDDGGTEEKR